jgi:predicted DNA-binding protein
MAKVKQIGIRLDAETLEKLTSLTQDGKYSQAQVITEAIEVLSSQSLFNILPPPGRARD